MIKKIWADNFKSLRNFELELRPFNVLVGANASGKTSIIDVFSFFQDAVTAWNGIEGAVGARGGWRGVNSSLGGSAPVTIGFEWPQSFFSFPGPGPDDGLPPSEVLAQPGVAYELSLAGRANTYRVQRERAGLLRAGSWSELLYDRHGQWLSPESAIAGTLVDDDSVAEDPHHLRFVDFTGRAAYLVPRWQFIDLEPGAMRAMALFGPGSTLVRQGANLAVLVRRMHPVDRERLVAAMRRDVPGFVDVHTHLAGGRVFLTIDEEASHHVPAEAISSGTLRLLALYSLYYGQERPPLLCFEEPENGLHPDLIETVADYLRGMTDTTQVIVTTHSPLFVDHCRPGELVLLEKRSAATRAMRVRDPKQVEEFLKDFSLGELWRDTMLEELV